MICCLRKKNGRVIPAMLPRQYANMLYWLGMIEEWQALNCCIKTKGDSKHGITCLRQGEKEENI